MVGSDSFSEWSLWWFAIKNEFSLPFLLTALEWCVKRLTSDWLNLLKSKLGSTAMMRDRTLFQIRIPVYGNRPHLEWGVLRLNLSNKVGAVQFNSEVRCAVAHFQTIFYFVSYGA